MLNKKINPPPHHQMSTTGIPPSATAILSSLLFLLLSLSTAHSWVHRYHGRRQFHGRQQSRLNLTGQNPVDKPPSLSISPRKQALKTLAREFLDAHNQVRAAKGLPPLTWDSKLARYARHYGTMRKVDCQMVHSMGEYGENLFWGGRDHWTPAEVVKSWAEEQEFYDVMKNTCQDGQMCGHYTQIVWKNTAKVGCARQKCVTGGLFVICNYDPPGNYIGEHPFGARPSADSQDSLLPPSLI